ncbi:MAG: response regulator [Alphaproteobacteria bacterium]|nr:response regulator [Alphaproteobacteria bacterium]
MSNFKAQIDRLSSLAQKPHVLVVDDDERLRQLISLFLTENDFLVTTAVDAEDARQKLKYLQYDLIVLDVMMPGEGGLALTKSLKADKITTPVLLLTALGETESRILGLEAGADDYLSKPFEPRELLLRMHAILRRVAAKPALQKEAVRFGRWTLDMERGELVDGDERLPLTQVEHNLLKALSSKMGEVVSREELARMCDIDSAERTIDVQVTRLRKKLEEDPKLPKYIQTVRGKGYVLWSD